jgi:hypothetical protein
MRRFSTLIAVSILSFSFFLILPSCDRTVEEEVIKPVELMYGQKNVAADQAAATNVQTVRAALMRYPATSPSGQYPGDMDIYDYGSLRETLSDANLPQNIAELMWDPAYGITYRSDGSTFTFEVRALTKDREIISATPGGITKN